MTASLTNSWYTGGGKRFLDVLASLCALLVLSPLMLGIALLVRLSSPGPVLFRQIRIGRYGRPFKLLKFRSMNAAAEMKGPWITAAGDPRVTCVGGFLRKIKFDELPQLWNVLRGDMSLVGPRPELERYVALYTDRQRAVLLVKPGITDPASIAYRHEERLLADSSDPERLYVDSIMPDKLRLNLGYLEAASLFGDLQLLLRTVGCISRVAPTPSIVRRQS
jgi:lipopolysaccharide/colanic/teichoic acid biosynthesis glycosyltransferase